MTAEDERAQRADSWRRVVCAALTEHLLSVVDEIMQPQTIGVWLRAPERRQP